MSTNIDTINTIVTVDTINIVDLTLSDDKAYKQERLHCYNEL